MKTGRWKILPITVRIELTGAVWVKGNWTGDHESAQAALAAID
jgi:hypothetical protein